MQFDSEMAGHLECRAFHPAEVRFVLVMLHGYAMDYDDLAPHAASLNLPAALYFPRGPRQAPARGRCWWPIDEERRAAQLEHGPRDLFDFYPPSREGARRMLAESILAIRSRHPSVPLFLAGFSQGGMIACDMLLNEPVRVDGLALLSTSSIAVNDWLPKLRRLDKLPVLVCHGRQDSDLSISAGRRLRDLFAAANAYVTWVEFDGGHEMSLTVWRQLKKYLVQVASRAVT